VTDCAAFAGMLAWRFLMVPRWRWLQMQHWSLTALFGSLISLIEIISTSCLMWIIYVFFLLLLTYPPIEDAIHVLLILPLGSNRVNKQKCMHIHVLQNNLYLQAFPGLLQHLQSEHGADHHRGNHLCHDGILCSRSTITQAIWLTFL
jgi:hypothetical protein